MFLECTLLRVEADHYALTGPLAAVTIPTTLYDSLMARLDRVPTVCEVAQLGAMLGREFAYELLHALMPMEEATLQHGWNLSVFYLAHAEHQTALELGEQCLRLAQRVQDEALLLTAHLAVGVIWFYLGKPALACTHLEHTMALYNPAQHHVLAYQYGAMDPGIVGFGYDAWALWLRGYPAQARAQSAKALSLAQQLTHPYTLARTLYYDTILCQLRRDAPAVRDQADAAITVATAQGFALVQALGLSCVAGPSSCRSTVPRASYRYDRVSTRTGRPGRNFSDRIFWPCWRRRLASWASRKAG